MRRITRGYRMHRNAAFAVQGGELSRSEAMRLLALEGMGRCHGTAALGRPGQGSWG